MILSHRGTLYLTWMGITYVLQPHRTEKPLQTPINASSTARREQTITVINSLLPAFPKFDSKQHPIALRESAQNLFPHLHCFPRGPDPDRTALRPRHASSGTPWTDPTATDRYQINLVAPKRHELFLGPSLLSSPFSFLFSPSMSSHLTHSSSPKIRYLTLLLLPTLLRYLPIFSFLPPFYQPSSLVSCIPILP